REREPRIAGGGEGGLERRAGFGFVVLDRDRAFSRAAGPEHELRTAHDLAGGFAHQRVVAADPRLAFRAVKYQVRDRSVAPLRELRRCRIEGPAQPHDSAATDPLDQI